jgi:deoxyribodipyrimidine photo-lyase
MPLSDTIPSIRILSVNQKPVLGGDGTLGGDYVLYWMTAFRRTRYNFALQRGVEWANRLGKPLLVFDALRCHYRWASDRFHRFIIDSMRDTARSVIASNASYCSYVEPVANHAHGLIEELAKRACVLVSDDFPCFFHPTMVRMVASRVPCGMEIVDSNTIVPMREMDRTFTVAHSYRRAMQKVVSETFPVFPLEEPLRYLETAKLPELPRSWTERYGLKLDHGSLEDLERIEIRELPIDHSVFPTGEQGGEVEARKVLDRFASRRLATYAEDRNEPEKAGSSWLSPYLHFGNISPHEVFLAIAKETDWSTSKLSKPNGKMEGFWNMGTDAEAFMDQLMTWREIGFNMCVRDPHYMRYESLPEWALTTLADHAGDRRETVYDLEQFEKGSTHDALWNAAQRQLVREGRIHNYLRMLWGKKILHWSESPQEALRIMIELNNKYALDGRNPNSYSGIFWVLGRYDRAWGPERPIFGKVRYMTSESTASKFSVKKYIRTYGADGGNGLFDQGNR